MGAGISIMELACSNNIRITQQFPYWKSILTKTKARFKRAFLYQQTSKLLIITHLNMKCQGQNKTNSKQKTAVFAKVQKIHW